MHSFDPAANSSVSTPAPLSEPRRGGDKRQLPDINLSLLMDVLDKSGITAILMDKHSRCLTSTHTAKHACALQKLFEFRSGKLVWHVQPLKFRRMLSHPSCVNFEIEERHDKCSWRTRTELLASQDNESLVLLLIEPIAHQLSAPDADWVMSQFPLTRKEAELATALAIGASTRTYANDTGLSIHTVRNQLKSIFDKLDVHSQKDLVCYITRRQARVDGSTAIYA